MNFLTRLRQRKAQQTETATERYRSLVAKAAKNGGDLADDDAKALERLCDAQAIPLERVEADIAALTRAAELEARIAAAGDVESARQQARKAAADYQAETNRLTAERTARQRELDKAAAGATNTMVELQQLRDDLAALHRQHFALFDAEDPAIAHRRRRLVHGFDGADLAGAMVFENLIADPANIDLAAVDFVLSDGQDPADFSAMVDAVRAAVGGRLRNARYLLERRNSYRPLAQAHRDRLVLYVEEREAAGESPALYSFIAYPGQTPDELQSLIDRMAEAHAQKMGKRPAEQPVPATAQRW